MCFFNCQNIYICFFQQSYMDYFKFMTAWVLLLPLLSNAQQKDYLHEKFLVEVTAGTNFSKFHPIGYEFSSGSAPVLGISTQSIITPSFSIKTSLLYSPKRSVLLHSIYKLQNNSTDFVIMPQFRLFEGLNIQGGAMLSDVLKSDFVNSKGKTYQKSEIKYSKTEINLCAGIEIKLQKHINLDITYQIPVKNNHTSSIQFTTNFILNKRAQKNISKHRIRKVKAHNEINDLHEGTLLVRLKTAENTIAAYEKTGLHSKADDTRLAQLEDNRQTIKAFRKHYKFSKVAFFYSTDSKKIKNQQFEGVFLNDSLQKDPSITINNAKTCIIGEFDVVEADTLKHIGIPYYDQGDNKLEDTFFGTPGDFSFTALVIRDNNFIQLRDPFPYYVSAVGEAFKPKDEPYISGVKSFMKWTKDDAVKDMNKKLENFYSRNKGK